MTHWATGYIGQPWVAGENDCWAFARRVWRERFGWDVPAVEVDSSSSLACAKAFSVHPEVPRWAPVEAPREGDACLMGRSTRPSHVGLWIDADGGGVLHSVKGIGVVYTPPIALGVMGLRVLGYYRRSGCVPTA